MKFFINRNHFLSICFIMGIVQMLSFSAVADARTTYFINMLEKGATYRVKVQAAGFLGQMRSKEAIPALKKALLDDNEAVVIAAATALGQIGDTTVIPNLVAVEKKTKSSAAKSQIATTLRILRALSPGSEALGTTVGTPQASTAKYIAKIDAMGNSSGSPRADVTSLMQKMVIDSIQTQTGVILQEEGLSEAAVRKKLASQKLKGFIISGALIKLEKVDNFIEISISLNVFSNPDYNLLMMPSGGIKVPAGTKELSPEERKTLEDKAIKRLIDDLVGKVMAALPDVL